MMINLDDEARLSNLLGRGPDVPEEDLLPVFSSSNGLGLKVNVDLGKKSKGSSK